MKKLFFTLSILLFFGFKSLAQKVYDIKADFITINNRFNTIEFYQKKSNGNYIKIQYDFIDFYDDNDKEYYELVFDTTEIEDLSEVELPLIKVDDLPDKNFETFKKELKKIVFIKEAKEFEQYFYDDIILNRFTQLDLFNDFLFSSRLVDLYYSEYDNNKKYNLRGTGYFSYFFFRINNKKLALILIYIDCYYEDIEFYIDGFILPFDEGLKVVSLELDNAKKVKKNKLQGKWKRKLRKEYFYNTLHVHNSYCEKIYNIDKENRLRELAFNQDVLGVSFDSLYMKYDFIIGELDEEVYIYNQRLDLISPKNTKAVHFGLHYEKSNCQILTDKGVKWLHQSGEVLTEKKEQVFIVCGTVADYYFEIEETEENFLLRERQNLLFVGGTDDMQRNILFSKEEFDKVYFLTETKELAFDGNSNHLAVYELPGKFYYYLIVKKDNKYGLLEVEKNENGLNFITHLPIKFDNIKPLGYYLPIMYEQNGLYGYYPMNQEVRYKKLEPFDGFFAPFTLPNGKKGWIDLKGKEYLD